MELTELTNLISSCGFPIACTIAMFYMWNKERDAHKEEMANMKESIDNNTRVMEKILAKIGGSGYE
jgi:hypothetical protein